MANNNTWFFVFFTMITIRTPASGVTANYMTSGLPHEAHNWLLGVLRFAFRVFQVHMCVCVQAQIAQHCRHHHWVQHHTRAPTTAMQSRIVTSQGTPAPAIEGLKYLKTYLKYPLEVIDLLPGLEPRLCRASVVTSQLQDVVLRAHIVGEHLQIRFA
jgi:hypothetical protein